MNLYSQFFNGKHVLVTGHTGFIGTWLTKSLVMLGSKVCGYSLDPCTDPNLFDALNLSEQIIDCRADILDRKKLENMILEFKPEIVFHLASQPIVLEAYDNPFTTFETNVTGTVNILDILRRTDSIKVIIVMTSDKAYHNNEWPYPYREIDPLGGKDPYSASKSCQDIVVTSFRDSYFEKLGVAVSSVRAGNIIGGGDWSKYRIIPDLVRGIVSNKSVNLRNPDSTRPWQYILNPLLGLLELTKAMWIDPRYSGGWNFGPDSVEQPSVKELVEAFIEYWGSGSYREENSSTYKESSLLKLDSSKARELLHWRSSISLSDGLKKSVEWYKTYYYNQDSIIDFTESQLKTFFNTELK